ncbi:MAG: hypothetical protein HKN25_01965 [Pyrinomonadaceae bacterium]|nr:hypothetical protein [Pyrinomonadaceae bacterium]
MKKTPSPETRKEKSEKKIDDTAPEVGEESSLSKDQAERNYYYDDAYGYKSYVAEEDGDDKETNGNG